ncbi:MAG TPA: hypothetical protein VJC16_06125 [Candidatus Nanoarchaeia archaeon]|nr:hypothetical protein [Candidatus Nanoarchaeia archaeon]
MGQKRGSLSLSVNAIVVLVLAVIIMSFAITFIQKYLREAEVGISGQFPELEVPVSAENPIGIGNNFLIKPGEERRVTVGVYNNQNNDVTISNFQIDCPNSPAAPQIQPGFETGSVSRNEVGKFKMVIKGLNGMQNNAICKISAGTIQQSFFLVTS